MRYSKLLARAFNGIVVAAVLAVLIAAVFFLHNSFERGVQYDILRFRHEVEDSVRRTVGTEYRRYFLLMDIGKSAGTEDTDGAFTEHLADKADIFGPYGEIPHLADSIGYFMLSEPEKAYEYVFATGKWRELDNIFNTKPMKRDWEWYMDGTGVDTERLYLAVGNREGEKAVFFRLDRRDFIDTYIKELIESTNTDFILEWYSEKTPGIKQEFETQFRSEPGDYSFRPLSILTGIKNKPVPLIIELPGIFDFRKLTELNPPPTDGSDEGRGERPAFFGNRYYVKMFHSSGSYYYDIEQKAAVNFLETSVIFFIIGLLFMLLLFQLQKTRIMRHKEKEFVASVTHELRTPLTVIRSAADNLCTGIVPEDKLPVYGGLITEQSERLGKMIEEILMYSNIEHRKRGPEEPVELYFPVLFEQLRPALDALADSAGIRLQWDIAGLPGNVLSYPEEIAVGVNNLVSNAVSHAYGGEKGDIRVGFRCLIPDKLRITVEDDGRGIQPRELKQIFEPFYRDSVSRKRYEKGSGLGLFITKRKASIAGGRLTVESPYRRIDGSKPSGCRFVLELPCFLPDEDDKNG